MEANAIVFKPCIVKCIFVKPYLEDKLCVWAFTKEESAILSTLDIKDIKLMI